MSVANRSRSAPVHHRAQVTAKLLSVLVVLSLLLAACAAPGAPAAPAAGGIAVSRRAIYRRRPRAI